MGDYILRKMSVFYPNNLRFLCYDKPAGKIFQGPGDLKIVQKTARGRRLLFPQGLLHKRTAGKMRAFQVFQIVAAPRAADIPGKEQTHKIVPGKEVFGLIDPERLIGNGGLLCGRPAVDKPSHKVVVVTQQVFGSHAAHRRPPYHTVIVWKQYRIPPSVCQDKSRIFS